MVPTRETSQQTKHLSLTQAFFFLTNQHFHCLSLLVVSKRMDKKEKIPLICLFTFFLSSILVKVTKDDVVDFLLG